MVDVEVIGGGVNCGEGHDGAEAVETLPAMKSSFSWAGDVAVQGDGSVLIIWGWLAIPAVREGMPRR
ncbi:hypothetical protein DMC61_33620 [Amycolatopsis sp. WAC 04169]|uniref:hypothetical protein n=1 Tax=Amycolatopsis sp. WAC 04169 TaxID=2203197 RepID=UPI000F79B2A6|nr:hypothetical protein [Amycolatopsis sp. WAC 04169]RSN22405.1 hypothetical protein DMC61_33620 [Amycolatopsis sp. WAC 04169]